MKGDAERYARDAARLAALPASKAEPGEIWSAATGFDDDDGAAFVTLLVLEDPHGRGGGLLYGWLLGLGPARLGWRDIDQTRGGEWSGSEWRRVA
jgi:hypothetical protein